MEDEEVKTSQVGEGPPDSEVQKYIEKAEKYAGIRSPIRRSRSRERRNEDEEGGSFSSTYSDSEYEEDRVTEERPRKAIVFKPRHKMWWWWVGLLAVAFVFGLVGWPYFIFMYRIAIPLLWSNIFLGIFEIIVAHIVLGLLMTSYLKCVFTDPGYVPPNALQQRGEDVNVCVKCDNWKPERAHHCSLCKRCVLKMDHHCPWVNNCVGFRNYKFFVLFLTYIPVAELVLLAFAVPHIIYNIKFEELVYFWNLQVVIVCLMAVIFGFGLGGFAAMHYRILTRNQTTLESFAEYTVKKIRTSSGRKRYVKEKVPNIYDCKSARKNFEQVFGTDPLLWFLPVHTEIGDGFSFPHSVDVVQQEAEEGRRTERRGRGPREGRRKERKPRSRRDLSDSDSDELDRKTLLG